MGNGLAPLQGASLLSTRSRRATSGYLHLGVCRRSVAPLQGASNWGLALVKERLEARKRGEKVEVPWRLPELRREWNRAKKTVAPWWRENSAASSQQRKRFTAGCSPNAKRGAGSGTDRPAPWNRKWGKSCERVYSTGLPNGHVRVKA
jgi:putative transposase